MKYLENLQAAGAAGISPKVLLEQIVPVSNGARRISMAYDDAFSEPVSRNPKTRRMLRAYANSQGISALTTANWNYFFAQEAEPDLRAFLKWMDSKHSLREQLEIEGHLFGYPQCCISNALEDKRNDITAKSAQREMAQLQRYVKINGNVIRIDRDILPSFFTYGFSPCKPDCPEATQIGRAVADRIPDEQDVFYVSCANNAIYRFLSTQTIRISLAELVKAEKRMIRNEPVLPKMIIE